MQRFRHDLGPAALDFALRAACFLFVLRYAENERPRDALLFWLFAFLGVWQKLTFIWYINAYLVAFVLVRGKTWAADRRTDHVFWSSLPHAIAYIAAAAWVGWVYVTFRVAGVQSSLGSGAGTPMIERIARLGKALGIFFQGVESIFMFHEPFVPKAAGLFLILFLGCMLIGAIRGIREVVTPIREKHAVSRDDRRCGAGYWCPDDHHDSRGQSLAPVKSRAICYMVGC